MRILVFEYISGGGLAKQDLPSSLLQEGCLMRNALLDDLCALSNVELLVLRDERVDINGAGQNAHVQYLTIFKETNLQTFLADQQETYDVVWLIAPETEGVLAFWCGFFNMQGKILATSAQQVVELCQDKFATFQVLQQAAIPCVPSRLLVPSTPINTRKSVLKINDSVGCEEVYLVESAQQWHDALQKTNPQNQYIVQPFIDGKVMSLSCLFYQGQAYFICCNEQHMSIDQQQFELLGCTVNVQTEKASLYQLLCQKIADAIPLLFGYVGIDFIQTETGDNLILEINPRLTSSYAGIQEALGINIAEQVLGILKHQLPLINKTKSHPVFIDIKSGKHHAG